ncbi:YqiA/YcfP family alpha/beta fold hydrolase, partial [Salinivibrio socompensis]
CGVGLGGYWSERIGFLCGVKQVMINPNLHPQENMQGKIDRPEEYEDIMTKCVADFRQRNQQRAMVILSREDGVLDSQRSYHLLSPFYPVRWDEVQTHKFKNLSTHLQAVAHFKQST